ncbi:hypothetical protein [Mammaliicoccus sciuri]|uniref:hypothetical protein n=1 Tax=Mammaliicoccus sciuri TaxID=1296 RepID=UPI001AAFD82B|nr:hypothetical protein [Mammaliicoccus sciuri]MBO3081167.1 hypothetical protein [Mammaliicoccus sciuri]
MKLTTRQREVLTQGYDNVLNYKRDLENAFREKYGHIYEQIVKDYLQLDGFPKDVKLDKVNFNLDISFLPEVMVDLIESKDTLENEVDYQAKSNDQDFYINSALDEPALLNSTVIIRTDVEEYNQEHPSVEYLAKRINDKYEVEELKEEVNKLEETKQSVKEAAIEEGFSDDINVDNLKYTIDVKLKYGVTSLSDKIIQTTNIGENIRVDDYIEKDLYDFIIKYDLYDIDVQIQDDPEDFE